MTKLNGKFAWLVAAACLAVFSPPAAGSAPDVNQQRLRHIGSITGDPEKDTLGYVVSVPDPQSVAPVSWSDAAGYVGTRTGNAERDTFGRALLQARTAAREPVGHLSRQASGLFRLGPNPTE